MLLKIRIRCSTGIISSTSQKFSNIYIHQYRYLFWICLSQPCSYRCPGVFNTLRPRQNGCHFADDTFKRIFLNENGGISINISLKFVHKGAINNIPASVQIIAWRRPGNKPLLESMMVSLPTHISVNRPQWVNTGTSVAAGLTGGLISFWWVDYLMFYSNRTACLTHTSQ